MQYYTRHMFWHRLTSYRLSRSVYMFFMLGYNNKMEKEMSNEEYTHQNFWANKLKKNYTKSKSETVIFITNPFFQEPFCTQVKKKKDDKTI